MLPMRGDLSLPKGRSPVTARITCALSLSGDSGGVASPVPASPPTRVKGGIERMTGPTRGGEQQVPHRAFSPVRNDKNDGMDFVQGPLPPRRRPRGLKPESCRPTYAALKRRSSTVCISRSTGQAGLSSTLENVGIDGAFPDVFSLG
jgi:hypothetical protein